MLTNQKSNVADLKLPPHNVEAEQSVLGGLMVDVTMLDDIQAIVNASDFYVKNHRDIFDAMQKLVSKSKPIDPITLSEHLEAEGSDVGLSYVGELAQNTPTVANARAYAEIVKEKSICRQMIQTCNNVSDMVFNPQGRSLPDLIAKMETATLKIANQSQSTAKSFTTNEEALKELIQYMEATKDKGGMLGLPTGFTDLDSRTSGLQNSDLIILAARPSMGKTTLAMNIATHASKITDFPVVVFSLEMPTNQLKIRELSAESGVPLNIIKTGQVRTAEHWDKFNAALINQKEHAKIVYCDEGGISPAYAKSQINKVIKQFGGVSMIVVDYLQLMTLGKSENRTQEVSEISRQLKAIAKHFDVPVLALSQLNRSLENRSNKRPMMSDLRESGAIEQDADLILFVYRDEVYNEDTMDKGVAEINIGKFRNGEIGTFKLMFDGAHARFQNLAPNYADEVRYSEFKEGQKA